MLIAETVDVFPVVLSCERVISIRDGPVVGLVASGWVRDLANVNILASTPWC